LQERPHRQTIELLALIVLMLIVGALGWYLQLGPELQVDASRLADVPTRIGRWQSTDVPLASVVERELRADFNFQRAYFTRSGDQIWLYVGYYGTARGGRPEHTPRGCYTGAGWGIESSRTVEIDSNEEFRANEYLIEQRGEQRLVHFWYRSHRRTGILGGLDQNIDRLLGRLLDGRADGALVRISTPISGDDTTAARGRLLSFASLLDPLLGEYWPTERRCREADPNACATKAGSKADAVSSTDDAGTWLPGAPSDSSYLRIAQNFSQPSVATPNPQSRRS
jgi:EpsI family protein